MAACVIGHIRVKNREKWDEYRGRVPETFIPWGGEVLFRGRVTDVLCGEHSYLDAVVIRFPDSKAAVRWYNSAAYQALIPIREQGADVLVVSCES